MPTPQPEPWLRGTHTEIDPVRRAVLHALLLTREDLLHWGGLLQDEELDVSPHGLPSVGFQMRHIAHSLDRLLTYAEGRALTSTQLRSLVEEQQPSSNREALFTQFEGGLSQAVERLLKIHPASLSEPRTVGRAHLPTTVAGLLIHCAEHTQRHTGQAVTTAKVLIAMRSAISSV
jgi:DinB superfamily